MNYQRIYITLYLATVAFFATGADDIYMVIDNIKYERCFQYTETNVVEYVGDMQGAIDRLEIPECVTMPNPCRDENQKCLITGVYPGAFSKCIINELILPGSIISLQKNVVPPRNHISKVSLGEGLLALADSSLHNRGLTAVELPEGLLYIGRDALSENGETLTEITIPSTVKWIGERALAMDISLKRIRCFAKEPPVAYNKTFGFEYPGMPGLEIDMTTWVDQYNCVLEVPEESVEKYATAPGWKLFYHIVSIPTQGSGAADSVEPDIIQSPFSLSVKPGGIEIMPFGEREIMVTNTAGQCICSRTATAPVNLRLPTGVYIISSGTYTRKIAIR